MRRTITRCDVVLAGALVRRLISLFCEEGGALGAQSWGAGPLSRKFPFQDDHIRLKADCIIDSGTN